MNINTYTQFHGEIPMNLIGQELRKLVRVERKPFKVVTGYGSVTGSCKSKVTVLRALGKMLREGSIRGFIPADQIGQHTLQPEHIYCQMVNAYGDMLYGDRDYLNAGVVFVFPR